MCSSLEIPPPFSHYPSTPTYPSFQSYTSCHCSYSCTCKNFSTHLCVRYGDPPSIYITEHLNHQNTPPLNCKPLASVFLYPHHTHMHTHTSLTLFFGHRLVVYNTSLLPLLFCTHISLTLFIGHRPVVYIASLSSLLYCAAVLHALH